MRFHFDINIFSTTLALCDIIYFYTGRWNCLNPGSPPVCWPGPFYHQEKVRTSSWVSRLTAMKLEVFTPSPGHEEGGTQCWSLALLASIPKMRNEQTNWKLLIELDKMRVFCTALNSGLSTEKYSNVSDWNISLQQGSPRLTVFSGE